MFFSFKTSVAFPEGINVSPDISILPSYQSYRSLAYPEKVGSVIACPAFVWVMGEGRSAGGKSLPNAETSKLAVYSIGVGTGVGVGAGAYSVYCA